jgi:hypothetical protein
MIPEFFIQLIIACLYLILQIGVFGKMILFDFAVPHIYVMFLIMLPMRINLSFSLLIAFIFGLLYDIFTTSAAIGVGSFSAVLLIALREAWIVLSVPRIYYNSREDLNLSLIPFNQFILFFLPLLFMHQFSYYLMDAFGFDNFGSVILHSIGGTIYTGIFCILISVFFYTGRRT